MFLIVGDMLDGEEGHCIQALSHFSRCSLWGIEGRGSGVYEFVWRSFLSAKRCHVERGLVQNPGHHPSGS